MGESADDYALKYMGGGEALAHSRMRMPRWFFGLMAAVIVIQLIALFAVIAAGKYAAAIGPAIALPVLAVVTLLFSHLRVTVTRDQLIVQYGLVGPRIAVERIAKVSVERYDWKRYGGWGMRRGRDGTMAYSVPGGSEQCLAVEYDDDAGTRRRVVISCEDPTRMVEAIAQAQTVKRANTGVRAEIERTETAREDETDEIAEQTRDRAGK
jgi:hypothetical protein